MDWSVNTFLAAVDLLSPKDCVITPRFCLFPELCSDGQHIGGGAMQQFTNPIEQNLLKDIVSLYSCDLETEIHSYLHLQCLACSKRAVINVVSRHLRLIESRRLLFSEFYAAKQS
jgi:hypothetical protein